MVPLKTIGRELAVRAGTSDVDAATPNSADGTTAAARKSRRRKNAVAVLLTADVQPVAPPSIAITEVTAEKMINEFEQARLLALEKGQASAAVTAAMAKARIAGLLKERPESYVEPAPKFDGNYNEAVRRIALLLRLAADETTSGQKR